MTLKSTAFRREREATWVELEDLVTRVEHKGLACLDEAELTRLPTLYRATLSSLSVARAISLDKALVGYLEALSARAYVAVYSTRRRFGPALSDFFLRRFPGAVRQAWAPLVLVTLVLALGIATGWAVVAADPERFYDFVQADYAQGRDPASSTRSLRASLYDTDHEGGALAAFSSFLFTHNARIGLLCLALGAVAGLPVFLLMFTNGLLLGAFSALFAGRGLGLDFWGWVLPHGVTELLALLLCGAAGLALGRAVVFPGRLSRLDELARAGRAVAPIGVGAVGLFFEAGLIEGVFRQTVTDLGVRWTVALATATLWGWYFLRFGRAAR